MVVLATGGLAGGIHNATQGSETETSYFDMPSVPISIPIPTPEPTPIPTPKPVATPTPVVEDVVPPTPSPAPVPVRTWPVGDPHELICTYPWPQGCAYALAVVFCESSLREWVDDNWPYVGWWQIDVELHAGLIASMGYTTNDMYHGAPNTEVAWALSSGGRDMAPWPACR